MEKYIQQEFADIAGAIKQIITQGRLTKSEREDNLGNILTTAEFIRNIRQRQTTDSGREDENPVASDNGAIDYEL